MRFTLDSNILVYALANASPEKREIARTVLLKSVAADAFLTAQVVGEFLNVIRRKFPTFFGEAIEQAKRLEHVFQIVATTTPNLIEGAELSAQHRLQFWDSVLWQVARSAGAAFLITEDLQDGFTLQGMTVLDPFAASNAERLAELLG